MTDAHPPVGPWLLKCVTSLVAAAVLSFGGFVSLRTANEREARVVQRCAVALAADLRAPERRAYARCAREQSKGPALFVGWPWFVWAAVFVTVAFLARRRALEPDGAPR